MGSEAMPQLPVIDLSMARLKAPGSWKMAVDEVVQALEKYGCFMAVYDEMSTELSDGVWESLEGLFDLPEEKKAVKELGVTYFKPNPELPLTEGFFIRNGETLEATQRFTNAIWPAGNDTFCKNMQKFTKLLVQLVERVQKMVFEGYGVDKNYYNGSDDKSSITTTYISALAKQAPLMEAPKIDKSSDSHTDKSFFSVFAQNQVKAFSIETKDGHWISLDPKPQHFIVMAGDALMGWSNGRIHSPSHLHGVTEHGIKEVNYSVSLSSIVVDTMETPPELVDDEHPLLFKPFSGLDFLQHWLKNPQSTLTDYCGVNN